MSSALRCLVIFFLHFIGELARDYCLGSSSNLFADSGFVKPAFEAGPYVRVFACHDCTSFNLCFASTNSSADVFCVFLRLFNDGMQGDQYAVVKPKIIHALAAYSAAPSALPTSRR
jgi:hypothetical protein